MVLGRFLSVFLFFLLPAHLQAIPVPNGGFERFGQNETLIDWMPLNDLAQGIADKSVKYEGKMSGRVRVPVSKNKVGLRSRSVAVDEGTVYILSGQMKFDAGSARRAFLQVYWLDDELQEMNWALGMSSWVGGGEEWMEVAGTVVAPIGAKFAHVVCVAEDWGENFEPFEVWFDQVQFVQLSKVLPTQMEILPQPVSEKREARIQVVVKDSVGGAVSDGCVVVMGTNVDGRSKWGRTKNGIVDFNLEVDEAPLVDGWVWARSGDVDDKIMLNDVLAGRIVGRILDAESLRDQVAFVVVQDSTGHVVLRRAFQGAFDVVVPPGIWWVTAQAGPTQVSPELQMCEVVAGDSVVVNVPLRDWVDLKARGWWAGDLNMRGAGGARQQFVDVGDVKVSAQAAGLDWALFTNYWDTTLRHYRSQDLNLWQSDFYGMWGRLFETPRGDVWTLGASAHRAEDVFGAQVLVHKDRGIVGHTRLFTPKRNASAVLFDVLSGPTFECLDVMSEKADDLQAQRLWFGLLNQGYRIAATASSQAVLDDEQFALPGQFRTYVHLDGDVTQGRLVQALAKGHSFVSSGPILLFSVFAAGPGSDLPVGRKRRATLQAWASGASTDFLTRIELIRNGEVVQAWDLDDQSRTHKLAVALQDSVDCWYVAKCYGADTSQVALTNPIYFRSDEVDAPEPVQAVVRGTIRLPDGSPVTNAQILVKDPLGTVVLETIARNGQFRLWASPTSTIEVQAKELGTASQRIFDNGHLVELLDQIMHVDTPPDTLFAPATVERVTNALKNIDMLFILNDK